eukprot:TRINITY_DN3461_c0_g1_i2.p1 TRINITY_DN3461_c0_g1~~TRINITY_DN3461_c0_g1_i2.p1  ORF type:complete len:335 (+),score=74.53 TRINITY_DN3461_c0_g1_i2:596-1600(+)
MEDQHATDVDVDFDLPNLRHVSLFSVFDGHAGKEAAIYARESLHHNIRMQIQHLSAPTSQPSIRQAIRTAFLQTDKDFLERAHRQKLPDGSTCVFALVKSNGVLVGNIGDSRAILCYEPSKDAHKSQALSPTEKCKVVEMSIDDKPNRPDEKHRIEASGGFISYVGCWRVQGALATSRSFGDRDLKRYVIADPQFIEVVWGDSKPSSNAATRRDSSGQDSAKSSSAAQMKHSTHSQGTQQQHHHHYHNQTITDEPLQIDGKPLFLIMATDGLWDVMSNQEVAHFVYDRRDTERLGADELVAQALYRRTTDNVTVAVVDLRQQSIAQQHETASTR